ncbi:enoyl-CoA hydratase family protein [Rhizohabitans arisaemae]|uniref:enoyl-CoA hydratase family protein n=1 Tax=Rhizohabitans arisaemae TaxID=2720610 RepID=UPI0024B23FAE|nr:enoyl-CoA hydratase family protein [Rhizohabitans arisaemae]
MSLVHLSVEDRIATITLDSPANRNALSRRLLEELTAHLAAAAADDGVHAVVLTHTGNVFSSGVDLAEARAEGMEAGTLRLISLFTTLVELPKAVVCRVAGRVRAGGLGILGSCDMVFASDDGDYAFSESRVGIAPAVISLTLASRLDDRAMGRYFLTGETFDAREAERIGLLTRAVPAEALDAAVAEATAALRIASPQGIRESKKITTVGLRRALAEHGVPTAALSARLFASEEAKEGMSAFLERRKPRWMSDH